MSRDELIQDLIAKTSKAVESYKDCPDPKRRAFLVEQEERKLKALKSLIDPNSEVIPKEIFRAITYWYDYYIASADGFPEWISRAKLLQDLFIEYDPKCSDTKYFDELRYDLDTEMYNEEWDLPFPEAEKKCAEIVKNICGIRGEIALTKEDNELLEEIILKNNDISQIGEYDEVEFPLEITICSYNGHLMISFSNDYTFIAYFSMELQKALYKIILEGHPLIKVE